MSLGKDLASIRKSQHLTLEDIQNAIKIPIPVLESIEDDTIFARSDESMTYIRSFIRSYARHLKISTSDIIQALDAVEKGTYNGDLLSEKKKPSHSQPSEPEPSTPGFKDQETERDSEAASGSSFTPPPRKVSAAPPPVESVNWADMGKRFNPGVKSKRAWLIIVIFIIISILGICAYIFSGEIASLFSSESTEELSSQPETMPVDTSTVIENEVFAPTEETLVTTQPRIQSSSFGDTLTIAVYAAYDILDPVRVTSDFNWRTNPFWMDQGLAYNFDFRDTLLVRGEYSDLILLFNGHVIENPRQNYFSEDYNSILITRSVLDQEKYRGVPPQEFPLEVAPPDTIIYRISF